MGKKHAQFRFYEELNDFLPEERRKRSFDYAFWGTPMVKDAIEAQGVPHVEVELIVVNGESVGFDYRLCHGDRVAVYPMFESIDITPVLRLRPRPLRRTRFVLDVHLGKLARRLRILGFDCAYRNDYSDAEIIKISLSAKRIILTRDRGILRDGRVTHGYWVRADDADDQVLEVLRHFQLEKEIAPFKRCPECNGLVAEVEKTAILDLLEPGTIANFEEFHQCVQCDKIYWKGSHYDSIMLLLADKLKLKL